MIGSLRTILRAQSGPVARRAIGLYAALIAFNVASAAYALIAFRHLPVMLAASLVAYGYGLRHAVDADHIAAIDNATRKLVGDGQRPIATGFFFSAGHCLVLLVGTVAIAALAIRLRSGAGGFAGIAGVVGTVVSSSFLFAMGVMNLVVARSVWRAWRGMRAGIAPDDRGLDDLLAGRGLLARLLRPLFRMVGRSWHMLPIGCLFGLGFDTVTEIGLLTVAATGAGHGLPIWSVLAFPALFSAGMSLVDTTDGILMLGAYGWAFVEPVRKLYYNLVITTASAVVALLIGGIETLSLFGSALAMKGRFWRGLDAIGDAGLTGCAVIAFLAGAWLVSLVVQRARRADRIEAGGT